MEQAIFAFAVQGTPVSCQEYGSGHINRTLKVDTDTGASYILQRINKYVFKDPIRLMENITSVTSFLASKSDDPYATLHFLKTKEGSYCADILYEDDFERDGDYLTTLYRFLDNVVRCDIARDHKAVPGQERYKLPGEEEREKWDNSEYFGCDLLAQNITAQECDTVSPIHFDNKFNITLPLYPQITIKLEPLPKSLYILLLHHPEGIVLKEIQDYESELKEIYSAVSGRKNKSVLDRMFKTLTDPNENPLHKNLSIIRRCFLSKLRFDLASRYIPCHSRAKAHSIPIDANLIELPEI